VNSLVVWTERFVADPLWGGIASLLTIAGIVFAAVYWWVLQRQDLRQQRWLQYQHAFEMVWNMTDTVPSGLQIAAAYQLTEFKEFSYATVCALEYTLGGQPNEEWRKSTGSHLVVVINLLKSTRSYKRQARRFHS
jgi:hypothetical protein